MLFFDDLLLRIGTSIWLNQFKQLIAEEGSTSYF